MLGVCRIDLYDSPLGDGSFRVSPRPRTSLVAQRVKPLPTMQETQVQFLGRKDPLEKGYLGFPGGSDSKESACNAGDLGLIPGLGRALGEVSIISDMQMTPPLW